jgi:hypothetical protein
MKAVDPEDMRPGGLRANVEKQQDESSGGGGNLDTGDIIDGIEGAGEIAGGALEVAGGALEAAGGALEVAGGCLDGCGSCSLAVFIGLFLTASAAFAVFK